MPWTVPPRLRRVAEDLRDAGGRACLVGGAVRDLLLDEPIKDLDVEVFGLQADALEGVLRRHGRVNTVGRAFGVFKLRLGDREIDVSLPRRDSKVGPGHRGIAVDGDPSMTVHEAALRRDLTVNAILLDLCTEEVIDPVGGVADLRARRLRAVDGATFLEDPLRAVRVAQFTARLGFRVDDALVALCAGAPLDELPDERIGGEWQKMLLRGRRPSLGLAFLRRSGLLLRLFPALHDDPALDEAVDRAVAAARGSEGLRLAIPLVTWLDATPGDAVPGILDRLAVHRHLGYPLRDRVIAAHAARDARPHDDAALRRLATRVELAVWLGAHAALRPTDDALAHAQARAEALDILHDAPPPLLQGRDLLALGVPPGPAVGRLLAAIYDRQLDGELTTPDDARAAAIALLDTRQP
jgi:tRNA nucleotidyltransferase (CCA-adding enzyme)